MRLNITTLIMCSKLTLDYRTTEGRLDLRKGIAKLVSKLDYDMTDITDIVYTTHEDGVTDITISLPGTTIKVDAEVLAVGRAESL